MKVSLCSALRATCVLLLSRKITRTHQTHNAMLASLMLPASSTVSLAADHKLTLPDLAHRSSSLNALNSGLEASTIKNPQTSSPTPRHPVHGYSTRMSPTVARLHHPPGLLRHRWLAHRASMQDHIWASHADKAPLLSPSSMQLHSRTTALSACTAPLSLSSRVPPRTFRCPTRPHYPSCCQPTHTLPAGLTPRC